MIMNLRCLRYAIPLSAILWLLILSAAFGEDLILKATDRAALMSALRSCDCGLTHFSPRPAYSIRSRHTYTDAEKLAIKDARLIFDFNMKTYKIAQRPALQKQREIRQIRRNAVDDEGNRRSLTPAEQSQIAALKTEIDAIIADMEVNYILPLVIEEIAMKALIRDTGTVIPRQDIPEGARQHQFKEYARTHAMKPFRFNGSLYALMRTLRAAPRLADKLRSIPGLVLPPPICDDQGVCTGGDEYLTVQARGWWS